MFSLSPKDDKFFDLFIENAHTIYETSLLFQDYVKDTTCMEEKVIEIKNLERLSDNQQHNILNELNKTFITPFDREDIYSISKKMDDIVDYMEASASRFVMFNVTSIKGEVVDLVELVVKSCENVIKLMEQFKNMRNNDKLQEIIIEINKIEEEGDLLFRKAVRQLFIEDIPVLDVLKWREIYQYVENTLDACESVANIIEGVAMKNA
jgi:predicted phosphate transport protein (TIGR00153 family)